MDPGKEVEELEVLTCLPLVVHVTAVQEVVSVNILLAEENCGKKVHCS